MSDSEFIGVEIRDHWPVDPVDRYTEDRPAYAGLTPEEADEYARLTRVDALNPRVLDYVEFWSRFRRWKQLDAIVVAARRG